MSVVGSLDVMILSVPAYRKNVEISTSDDGLTPSTRRNALGVLSQPTKQAMELTWRKLQFGAASDSKAVVILVHGKTGVSCGLILDIVFAASLSWQKLGNFKIELLSACKPNRARSLARYPTN